jgi:hypothetical protein
MAKLDLEAFDPMLMDMYALPGARLKQWVVDSRRNGKWERETCPMVDVPVHDDNCESRCRNSGPTRWSYLDHDACHICNDLMEQAAEWPDIIAWKSERAKLPPIESDRSKLSNEFESDWATLFKVPK